MSAATTAGWVELYEEVLDSAVAMMLDRIEEIVAAVGPRPLGFRRGTILEQIAAFLDVVHGGAPAWERTIGEWASLVGRAEAETIAWRESTRLWQAIDQYGGEEAVAIAIRMAAEEQAARALHKAEALLAKPRATVRAVTTPPLDQAALEQLAAAAASVVPNEPLPELRVLPFSEKAKYPWMNIEQEH